ncbi:MAG: hypothetical protein IJM24_00515 [Clostridia bacterium]|nr:hypothetical protein [Clostridia bacterium]
MHKLTVRASLPLGYESPLVVTVSAPGTGKQTAPIDRDHPCAELPVPGSFHLTIRQSRKVFDKDQVKDAALKIAGVLVSGGKAVFGEEYSSPEYALWEADCEISEDSELEVSFRDEYGQLHLSADAAGNARISNVQESVQDDPQSRHYFKRFELLFLIPFSAALIGIMILVLSADVETDENASEYWTVFFKYLPKIIFTVLPLLILFVLWRRFFTEGRPVRDRSSYESKKRRARNLIIGLNFGFSAVFVAVIACFFILPLLGFGDFIYTFTFFCVFAFIVVILADSSLGGKYHLELTGGKLRDPFILSFAFLIVSLVLVIIAMLISMAIFRS